MSAKRKPKLKAFSREDFMAREMGKRHPMHTMFDYWPTYSGREETQGKRERR